MVSGLLAIALLSLALAPPAPAAPLWNLDLHHNPTDFPPGGTGEYWFDVANVGDSATSGPISLRIVLPRGLRRDSLRQPGEAQPWSCPGAPGDKTILCTSTTPIPRHTALRDLILTAAVAPGASGQRSAAAKLEGAGAPAAVTATEPTRFSPEPAPFGITARSFLADSFQADGLTPVREAGAHPYQASFALDLNSLAAPTPAFPRRMAPAGDLRDFQLELPPGFLGNPAAVGDCAPAQLTTAACPRSSQVGRVDLTTYPFGTSESFDALSLPVFNMSAPRGVLADLAFQLVGNPIHIRFSLDPARGYAILASASDVNEAAPAFNIRLTLWGTPADPGHDFERCPSSGLESELVLNTSEECPTDAPPRPFLTLPSQCGIDQAMTLRNYDSWQQSGVFGPEVAYPLPGQTTGCDRPRFEPELQATPTVSRADSPTGLEVHLGVNQNDNPNALATPPIKDVRVTLPDGVRISPATADGLTACSPAQVGLRTNDPVACPDSSRIGAVTITTPLLPEPLEGFIYLAAPHDNPFQSLFAIYLVVQDTEGRAALLKLPGRLDLNPATGRVSASFEDLPQLPFADLNLRFRSGAHAPLVSAPDCGSETVSATISSYARPEQPLEVTDSFQVSEGPGGVPCAPESKRPFAPQLSAGTINPLASANTPFIFALRRSAAEQELSRIAATLPPGLSADIAAVPPCPQAAIAAIDTAAGSGQHQLDSPSCPPASRLGSATIAAGAGPEPLYLSGAIYLAGPHQGAQFSLLVVVPAMAGPFDLGTLTSRIAVHVDPQTAQLRLIGEPLPTILAGVPIDLRSIRLELDRPGLITNPTSCAGMTLGATATSAAGLTAPISDRFQVGGCASLGFRPAVSVRLAGATARNGHPRLTATLHPRPGDADPRAAELMIPRGELIDPTRLTTVCTRAEFATHACPAASRRGSARATSPHLRRPLEGPVYLRESASRYPDLAVDLQGEVELELTGQIRAPGATVRADFARIPDLALSSLQLTLDGGKRGLLANSESLCRRPWRAMVALAAHNGKRLELRPPIRVGCAKHRPKPGARR